MTGDYYLGDYPDYSDSESDDDNVMVNLCESKPLGNTGASCSTIDHQKTADLDFGQWLQNCTGPGTKYADPKLHTFEATVGGESRTKWRLRTPDVRTLSNLAYGSAQCSEGGSSTVIFKSLVGDGKSHQFRGMTEGDLKNVKARFDRVGEKIMGDPADVQVVG